MGGGIGPLGLVDSWIGYRVFKKKIKILLCKQLCIGFLLFENAEKKLYLEYWGMFALLSKNHMMMFMQGKETSDPEHGKQCPFFEELHAVFTERAHSMQRLLLESETRSAQTKKGVKKIRSGDRSSDEFSEDDEEVEDDSEEERPARSNTRKRKAGKIATEKSSRANNANNSTSNIQEVLKEFFQHQLKMEMQWREVMERRAHEKQLFEQEWRQSMEKLERERLMIEQEWREREEHRRLREENRAERRDALLTTLLNKLIHESN